MECGNYSEISNFLKANFGLWYCMAFWLILIQNVWHWWYSWIFFEKKKSADKKVLKTTNHAVIMLYLSNKPKAPPPTPHMPKKWNASWSRSMWFSKEGIYIFSRINIKNYVCIFYIIFKKCVQMAKVRNLNLLYVTDILNMVWRIFLKCWFNISIFFQFQEAKTTFLLACKKSPSCVSWLGVGIACYRVSYCSTLASCYFCRLLITFANSLDPDQDRHNVGPDLDPNCLTLW